VRYHYKADSAENIVLQRENDSLILCADRYQLRADMHYRHQLLDDTAELRRLPASEIRYLTDTAVTESRNLLYVLETQFRYNYGVVCVDSEEALKQ
jgi:hypothetical protein